MLTDPPGVFMNFLVCSFQGKIETNDQISNSVSWRLLNVLIKLIPDLCDGFDHFEAKSASFFFQSEGGHG